MQNSLQLHIKAKVRPHFLVVCGPQRLGVYEHQVSLNVDKALRSLKVRAVTVTAVFLH